MTARERCDEIIRLIDTALAGDGASPSARPAPGGPSLTPADGHVSRHTGRVSPMASG